MGNKKNGGGSAIKHSADSLEDALFYIAQRKAKERRYRGRKYEDKPGKPVSLPRFTWDKSDG